MNHAQQYRLADEADQQRLNELTSRDAESVCDVSAELGLARFLAERCALTNPGLCNAILGNIAKLSIAAERHAVATNELLARPALWRFTKEMIAIVCDELRPLPNGETIIESICQRLDSAFAAVKNETEEKPKLLSYERTGP